ncbi:conserved hypothetical protein [Ricinus communis]|uniref:Uncharacterized protein n=1 Tax=Ricinus communis TaxID=3988 RepID=B9SIV8_RICCO|nr:conserved hypothetical protein [Ricinus communis]
MHVVEGCAFPDPTTTYARPLLAQEIPSTSSTVNSIELGFHKMLSSRGIKLKMISDVIPSSSCLHINRIRQLPRIVPP